MNKKLNKLNKLSKLNKLCKFILINKSIFSKFFDK